MKIWNKICGVEKGEDMTEEKKKINKKALLGVGILVALIAVFVVVYLAFGAKPVAGSKNITIEVIGKEKAAITYEVSTDAEFLRQAMEEAEGLEFSGTESQYGLTVEVINGETTDFNNGSYWSFYVNDVYCNYGIDSQPVMDGDAFKIVYEVYEAQ